jgi:hypothetical protein
LLAGQYVADARFRRRPAVVSLDSGSAFEFPSDSSSLRSAATTLTSKWPPSSANSPRYFSRLSRCSLNPTHWPSPASDGIPRIAPGDLARSSGRQPRRGSSPYAHVRVRRDAAHPRLVSVRPHGQPPWCAPADPPTLMEHRGVRLQRTDATIPLRGTVAPFPEKGNLRRQRATRFTRALRARSLRFRSSGVHDLPSTRQRDRTAQNDARPSAICAPRTGVPCDRSTRAHMCRYGAPGGGRLVTFGARVRCADAERRVSKRRPAA